MVLLEDIKFAYYASICYICRCNLSYKHLNMVVLGFIIRMCLYIIFVLGMLMPIGFLLAYLQHEKKVKRIERHRREIFGDDD